MRDLLFGHNSFGAKSKRRKGGGGPVAASTTFGALTLAGYGDYPAPVGVTSITDAGGTNLELSGGILQPVSNGVNSGTVTFDTGDTVAVTAEPNAYSCSTEGQLRQILNNTSALAYGDTVRMRAGTYTLTDRIRRITGGAITGTYTAPSDAAVGATEVAGHLGKDLTTGNPVVITGHSGEATPVFQGNVSVDNNEGNTYGLRFTGLDFYRPDGSMDHGGFVITGMNGARDITLDGNTIRGPSDFVAGGLDDEIWSGVKIVGDNCVLQNNTLRYLAVAVNGSGTTDGLTIVGNTFEWVFEDVLKVTGGADFRFNWNTCDTRDALNLSNPIHADFCQWVGPLASADDIQYIGNRFMVGNDAPFGVTGQGFFFDNMAGGTRMTNVKILGNFASLDMVNGVLVQQADGLEVIGNTIFNDYVRLNAQTALYATNQAVGQANITGAVYTDNVTHGVGLTDCDSPVSTNNNTSLDYTSTSTYTALFDAPKGGDDLTLANWEASFAPKAAGALDVDDHEPIIGAVAPSGRTAWFDHRNKTFDLPHYETAHTPSLTDLTDQTVSTAVATSEQVTGVSATGALIQISGGNSMTWEIRESNNSTVVEASIAPGERRVIYANQYYHIADTTSASEGTQTDVTVNVGAQTDTWSHTTEVTAVATEVSYIGQHSTTYKTGHTFSGVSIGAADNNRHVVVALGHTRGSSGDFGWPGASGVTIGGVQATQVAYDYSQSGTGAPHAGIYVASVPTGTTADVVISASDQAISYSIGVYRLIRDGGFTAHDTANAGGTGTSTTLDLNTSADGALVAVVQSQNGSANTWSGATEDYDIDANTNEWNSGASETGLASTETPRAVSVTRSSSKGAGCAVSWS